MTQVPVYKELNVNEQLPERAAWGLPTKQLGYGRGRVAPQVTDSYVGVGMRQFSDDLPGDKHRMWAAQANVVIE